MLADAVKKKLSDLSKKITLFKKYSRVAKSVKKSVKIPCSLYLIQIFLGSYADFTFLPHCDNLSVIKENLLLVTLNFKLYIESCVIHTKG